MMDEDARRLEDIAMNGWDEGDSKLVRLTEEQQVKLHENMMVKLQKQIGFDTAVVMEIRDHVALLDDGVIIIEARGRVKL